MTDMKAFPLKQCSIYKVLQNPTILVYFAAGSFDMELIGLVLTPNLVYYLMLGFLTGQ